MSPPSRLNDTGFWPCDRCANMPQKGQCVTLFRGDYLCVACHPQQLLAIVVRHRPMPEQHRPPLSHCRKAA